MYRATGGAVGTIQQYSYDRRKASIYPDQQYARHKWRAKLRFVGGYVIWWARGEDPTTPPPFVDSGQLFRPCIFFSVYAGFEAFLV